MKPWLLAALLLGAGCAEMTRPPPSPPPLELVGGLTASPLLALVAATAIDFDRGGPRLTGNPAAVALAIARLEWLNGEFQPGNRLAPLPDSYMFGMQNAVREGRESLGIKADATRETIVPALLAVRRALLRNDQAAIDTAFASPIFEQTNNPVLVRLRNPGGFPNAALATSALRDEVARLAQENQTDRGIVYDDRGFGTGMTSGLGGEPGR